MLIFHLLFDHFQLTFIPETNIPPSYTILYFTVLDLNFTTRCIHNCTLFLLWLSLFIPCGGISPLSSSIILDTYQPGGLVFQCHIFLPFFSFSLLMGFWRNECWSGLLFPSPVDHILSELFTITYPSWVALHHMAHSFIKLHKAVIHVVILVSFLWFWFSFCLPSVGWV